MLAERLPGLLPELDDRAALEVSAVHSVAGLLSDPSGLVRRAPFQAPHHSASVASLVGGGSHLAQPGAISLAHRGVLFLDEAPEFAPRALEALRQPLEGGRVVLHRSGGAITYPARFLLVLAANPCPCAARSSECVCPRRFAAAINSGCPVRCWIASTCGCRSIRSPTRSCSIPMAAAARRQHTPRSGWLPRVVRPTERWDGTPWRCNADVPGAALRRRPWSLPPATMAPAEVYLRRGELSARGFDRVLRLSWTLADLSGRTVPAAVDVAEALFLRTGVDQGRAA